MLPIWLYRLEVLLGSTLLIGLFDIWGLIIFAVLWWFRMAVIRDQHEAQWRAPCISAVITRLVVIINVALLIGRTLG